MEQKIETAETKPKRRYARKVEKTNTDTVLTEKAAAKSTTSGNPAKVKSVLSVGPQPVSDRRSLPAPREFQATSDCHSANAAERRSR